jgi:hypothetical protein
MITSKPANGTTQDKKSFTAFRLIGQVFAGERPAGGSRKGDFSGAA